MFDFLSQKFSSIFSTFSSQKKISQKDIDAIFMQVKDALLSADVPYQVVEDFAADMHTEVIGKQVHAALKPAEQLMKVIHEHMVRFLGGANTAAFSFQIPSTILVMGLQGSGKTTTIAKLAHRVKKTAGEKGKTRRILLASVDYYRPAAIEQLEQLAQKVGVDFYRAQATDPVKAAREIQDYVRNNSYELLFLDTAGRLHVDNALLLELQNIDSLLVPKHKLLVLDAMTGQESLNVARAFDQAIGFNGAILTKMDSDTRGGAAFSFRYSLKEAILFVGIGEKIDDLDQFYPDRAAGRMLGMGDLTSLAEKADEKIKKAEQENMYKKVSSGTMSLDDFAKQMDMITSMGSLSSLMKYMPGMGNQQVSPDMMEKGESELKKFRAILSSMTKKERLFPDILDGSRKQRIAKGAGIVVSDINLLLNRFKQMQQYGKLLKRFGLFK